VSLPFLVRLYLSLHLYGGHERGQLPYHVQHCRPLLQAERDVPPGDLLGCVWFDHVIDDNSQARVLLAEIQNLADGQRFIDLESLFAQVLAETWQFAGEVDQGAHEISVQ
jgi:hypothetical protein